MVILSADNMSATLGACSASLDQDTLTTESVRTPKLALYAAVRCTAKCKNSQFLRNVFKLIKLSPNYLVTVLQTFVNQTSTSDYSSLLLFKGAVAASN